MVVLPEPLFMLPPAAVPMPVEPAAFELVPLPVVLPMLLPVVPVLAVPR